jgi:hypothetical protein
MITYLVCNRKTLAYSQDYCDALCAYFGWTYQFYDDEDQVSTADFNFSKHKYIFRLVIPPVILINLLCHFKSNVKKIGVINTEQLRPGGSGGDQGGLWYDLIELYANYGFKIYTYDLYQAKSLKFPVTYLPYPPIQTELDNLKRLIETTPKLYDVAFCTNNSPHRREIWDKLVAKGLKLIDATGWGLERDMKIAQARVLINVHYDDSYKIFEHVRCDRWILCGHLVVSELSLSDSLLDHKDLFIRESASGQINLIQAVMSSLCLTSSLFHNANAIIAERKTYLNSLKL